ARPGDLAGEGIARPRGAEGARRRVGAPPGRRLGAALVRGRVRRALRQRDGPELSRGDRDVARARRDRPRRGARVLSVPAQALPARTPPLHEGSPARARRRRGGGGPRAAARTRPEHRGVSARLCGRERIAVRAPSWLGDFVAAEPALRALFELAQRANDGRGLAFVAPERYLRLLEGRFPRVPRNPLGPSRAESVADWRERDVALLLDGSMRSAVLAARAGVPVRAGFASGGRSLLLTHGLVPARERGGVPIGLGRSGRPPRRLPRPFAAACAEL